MLLTEVKGKDITELIACGREKLASVPSGGGGAAAYSAPAGGAGGGAAPAAAAETKKEEKVEEKEESDDVSFCLLHFWLKSFVWLRLYSFNLFIYLMGCLFSLLQDMGFSLFD